MREQTLKPNGMVTTRSPQAFPLFSLGFRPFFLVAALSAIALVLLWLLAWRTGSAVQGYYDPMGWHSHEMVFGYAAAVIAGFLLTAVRNWTGLPTAAGGVLAGLVGVWLLGRLAPLLPLGESTWLIAVADIAFLPALAIAIGIPLVRARKTHNLVFLLALGMMILGNVLIHLQALGVTRFTAVTGVTLAMYMVLLLIVILGGRVIPFFIKGALPDATPSRWRVVEILAVVTVVAVALAKVVDAGQGLTVLVAGVAAVVHGARLYGWHVRRLWRVPLLWVLYLGYGWLVVGFAMTALAGTGAVSPFLAAHAITAGAMGVMTLGMMARVALGHSGRPLEPARPTVLAFGLINLAAALRVFGPWFAPGWYAEMVLIAGALWIAAFALFVGVYGPILVSPRVDAGTG